MKVKKWREQEALAAATSEHGLIATPARAAG